MAAEDDVLKKLRRATAGGVRAGDFSLSAERVQTVLRHTQEVLKNYERVHGTKNFLNDTFQACDMKCAEFELVRFSSEVLGVETGCSVDDGTTPEKTSEEIKEIVARKNWLRLQDWEDNRAVLAAKTEPINVKLCSLNPESSLDRESIRFHKDTQEFYVGQYRTFLNRYELESARIQTKLEKTTMRLGAINDLPDEDECGIIDLDGKKVGPAALEVLDGGRYRVKLILKDPIVGVDIRGIGSGVAEVNEDGTPKEVRVGSYPKPRGRAPLNKPGEAAEWCSKTGTWLGVVPKKSPAKKRKKSETSSVRMGGLSVSPDEPDE